MKSAAHPGTSVNAGPAPSSARRWIAVYAICLGASIAAFSPEVFAPDPVGFVGGPGTPLRVSLVSNCRNIPEIFGGGFMTATGGHYRPLSYALLAVARTFVPAEWTAFWQVWILAFHALAATLLFALVRRISRSTLAAATACGIFLLHPLVTVFGNRIAAFHEVLGATLFLGAWLVYDRFAETGRARLYVVMLPLFAAGLLATKSVVALPVILAVDELARRGNLRRPGLVATRLAPFAALVLLMVPLWASVRPNPAYYVYPEFSPGVGWYSFASATAAAPRIAAGFLGGLGIPAPLDEVTPQLVTAFHWQFVAAFLVLAALAALAVWRMKKQWLGLGLIVILATLIPWCTTLVNPTAEFVSWDYLYLPLAGFALIAGGAVDAIARPESTSRATKLAVAGSAAAVVLLFASVLTVNNALGRTAQRWWARVLVMNPDSARANLALGRSLLDSGDARAAMPRLFAPSLTRVNEGSAAAARWYVSRGEPLAAAAHLRYCIDAPNATFDETNNALVATVEVTRALGAMDWTEDGLGQLIDRNPRDAGYKATLARLLTEKGYARAGARLMRRAVDLEPGREDFRRELADLEARTHGGGARPPVLVVTPEPPAELQYAVGRPVAAPLMDAIVRLGEAHPDDPILQLEAGLRLAQQGKNQAAWERVVKSSETLRSFPYVWAARCWLARELGKDDDALRAALHVTLLGPLEPAMRQNIFHNLGYLFDRKGLLKDSEAYYRMSLDARETAEAHAALAGVLIRLGRSDEAARYLRRAVEMGLDTGSIENNLGRVLLDLKRPDEALVHLRRAVELDPGDVRAHRSLARALVGLGRYFDARDAFEQGLKRFPDDDELDLGMAMLLSAAPDSRLRDGARAVRIAEEAVRRRRTPEMLDALAAAYAESQKFDAARRTEEEAIRLAAGRMGAEALRIMEEHLRLYTAGKPIRFVAPAAP